MLVSVAERSHSGATYTAADSMRRRDEKAVPGLRERTGYTLPLGENSSMSSTEHDPSGNKIPLTRGRRRVYLARMSAKVQSGASGGARRTAHPRTRVVIRRTPRDIIVGVAAGRMWCAVAGRRCGTEQDQLASARKDGGCVSVVWRTTTCR